MQTRYLQNGQPLKFPDGMTDAEMGDAIKRNYSSLMRDDQQEEQQQSQQQADETFHPRIESDQKGASGIAIDTANAAADAPFEIAQMVSGLPKQIGESGSQIIHNPIRAAENVAAGLASGTKDVLNVPGNIAGYLARKETLGSEYLKMLSKIHIGDTGLQKAFLGNEQPGDAFIQGVSSFAAPGGVVGKLGKLGKLQKLSKGVKVGTAGALSSIGQNQNPITGALIAGGPFMVHKALRVARRKAKANPSSENMKTLEMEEAIAQENNDAAQQDLKDYKEQARESDPSGTPADFKRKSIELQGKSDVLQKDADVPFAKPKEGPKNRPELDTGEEAAVQANENVDAITKSLRKHLGEGSNHKVNIANNIMRDFNANKAEIVGSFEEMQDRATDTPITVENVPDANKIESDLKKIFSHDRWGDDTFKNFRDKFVREGTTRDNTTVGALLTNYRVTKSAMHSARRASTQAGTQLGDQLNWGVEADRLEAITKKQRKILEPALGPEDWDVFQNFNDRYSTEVGPVHSDKLFKQIRPTRGGQGLATANVIESISGSGEGPTAIRRHATENPDTALNVLGQKFASNPEKLLKRQDAAQPYLASQPQLQSMLASLERANQQRTRAGEHVAAQKPINERITKERKARDKTEATERDNTIKEQENRLKAKAQIEENRIKLNRWSEVAKDLKAKIAKGDLTAAQLKLATRKLKEANEQVSKAKAMGRKIIHIALLLSGVHYGKGYLKALF